MTKKTKPLLSIITPCFNEEANINVLYERVLKSISKINKYRFEFIVIDNASTDRTVSILKKIAKKDKNFKIILNNRNYGHIRSPYYGILQTNGLATIYLASDLQDPPELIPKFINEWESGHKLVMAVKPKSKNSFFMHLLRKIYYRVLGKISDITLINDSTGFGLYDKSIIDHLRKLNEPYPFLRGLICELGYKAKTIPFTQPKRYGGVTKNNLTTLYDIGILGIVNHSKFPIRLAAFFGFLIGLVSMLIGFLYICIKLIFWDTFPVGVAPVIIGLFFLLGLQLFFIGILGEYIGSIHTYIQKRPLVVEKERINFG